MSKSRSNVYITTELSDNEQARKLAADFRKYKQTGNHQNLFGRDVPFVEDLRLVSEEIAKVHVIEAGQYIPEKGQDRNTCDTFHLVYCPHATVPNVYCIIDALEPDKAHSKARDPEFVKRAVARASRFRNDPKVRLRPSIDNKKVS